jgi:hypothetical protein
VLVQEAAAKCLDVIVVSGRGEHVRGDVLEQAKVDALARVSVHGRLQVLQRVRERSGHCYQGTVSRYIRFGMPLPHSTIDPVIFKSLNTRDTYIFVIYFLQINLYYYIRKLYEP